MRRRRLPEINRTIGWEMGRVFADLDLLFQTVIRPAVNLYRTLDRRSSLDVFVIGCFVFYMTFGARPLQMTALIDPETSQIYLTTEMSRYFLKGTDPKITVRFYSHDRQPMTDELPWKFSMTLPVGLGNDFFIRYSGYKEPVWIEVNRERNTVILPNGTMTVTNQLSAVEDFNKQMSDATAVVAQPSASPTVASVGASPTATAARTRVGAIATNTPRVTLRPPTATPRPRSVIPTSTAVAVLPSPTATSGSTSQADLTITYNARAMFITNTSGKPISIDGLKVGRLTVQSWLKVVQFNVARFPNGYCLQATVSGSSGESAPGTCRNVQAEINVLNNPVFWMQADFDIKLNDTLLQQCVAGAGRCEVDLP